MATKEEGSSVRILVFVGWLGRRQAALEAQELILQPQFDLFALVALALVQAVVRDDQSVHQRGQLAQLLTQLFDLLVVPIHALRQSDDAGQHFIEFLQHGVPP